MKYVKSALLLTFIFCGFSLLAQLAPEKKDSTASLSPDSVKSGKDSITGYGVAVSPSTIRYRTKPGMQETKYLTITNDTKKTEKFKISLSDYDMNNGGAVKQVPVSQNYEYGLSKWVSIAPTFVELKPGEKKKIAVTIKLPDDSAAYRAAWCLLMVDEATEKKYITPPTDGKNNIAMGVIPVFGFGVYIFQNPPNVKINKVEITDFKFQYDAKNKYVQIKARNVGDGVGFCRSYVEINNLNTGYKEKLPIKNFTIFPKMARSFEFALPGTLVKGKYIATAVLDFGSDMEIEAAELEFTVD